MDKLKVCYDDRADQIVEMINDRIERLGYYFESDETEHDGFEIWEMKKTESVDEQMMKNYLAVIHRCCDCKEEKCPDHGDGILKKLLNKETIYVGFCDFGVGSMPGYPGEPGIPVCSCNNDFSMSTYSDNPGICGKCGGKLPEKEKI